jgi:hypothetical protein
MSSSSKPFETYGIPPLNCSGDFVSSWQIENFQGWEEEEGAQNLK